MTLSKKKQTNKNPQEQHHQNLNQKITKNKNSLVLARQHRAIFLGMPEFDGQQDHKELNQKCHAAQFLTNDYVYTGLSHPCGGLFNLML